MAKTLIYLGSYTEIQNPKIIVGRHTKDFGFGSYCTVIREQAERWAKRFNTPVINVYSVLFDTSLDILEVETMTDEWLDFIANCRSGTPHKYDIVIGAMADDQIYNYIADYLDGVLSRDQFWSLAKFKYPTHQIAFCSQCALQCLHFENSMEI